MQMELRFITFNSIIHDNLMPWLAANQDPEKFRLILRKMATVIDRAAGPFFGALPTILSDIGINPGQQLTGEWEMLSKTPVHPGMQEIVSPFLQLSDDDPKVLFYTALIAQNMAAGFSHIAESLTIVQSDNLRKHRIMRLMKSLAEIIIHTRPLKPVATADRAIIVRLLVGLSVLFIETIKHFPDAFEPHMLRVSLADIRNILLKTAHSDENTQALFGIYAARYFPVVSKPVTHPSSSNGEEQLSPVLPYAGAANPQNTDAQLLMEIVKTQEEYKAIVKDVIMLVNKKENHPKPKNEDRQIGSAEACKLLHISKSTLKEHRDKKLYAYTKIGSRYYYSARQIYEILRMKGWE